MRYVDEYKQPYNKSFALGSLVHCMVLEPDKVDERYIAAPHHDRRTKEYKIWANHYATDSRTIVSAKEWDTANACSDAVYDNPFASALFTTNGIVEASYRFKHRGIQCKFRPDKLIAERKIVVDLKTISECTLPEILRSVRKYKYGLQAAHYTVGAETVCGGTERFSFYFVFVETSAPFRCCCLQVLPDSLENKIETWGEKLCELVAAQRLNDFSETEFYTQLQEIEV
jgi:exodeoxyribonuclease VIII